MLKIIMLGLVLAAIALSSATSVASTEIVPSPLQQVQNGVPIGEIVCSEKPCVDGVPNRNACMRL